MAFYEKIETWLSGATKVAAVALVAGAGLTIGTERVEAATCPSTGLNPPSVTRVMDATGQPPIGDVAKCYAYGDGNPTSGNDAILAGGNTTNATFTLDANFSTPFLPPDIAFVEDVDTDAGANGTYLSFIGGDTNGPGTFTVKSVVPGYANLIVALKMGGGPASVTPEWFSWLIPNVAGTYDWSYTEGRETGLSGIGVYGVVPLPAAAWLLIAGLGGLGLIARRRKPAAA